MTHQLEGRQVSFNISPSNEHPGLISFRMEWLDLLAVQGTLKSQLLAFSAGKEQAAGVWETCLVLEKTLESPLDCKKIQPVHPKGN